MTRSIYVPLQAEEVDLLVQWAKQEHRKAHDQASYLLSQAIDRWRAEQAFERSLSDQRGELEEVA